MYKHESIKIEGGNNSLTEFINLAVTFISSNFYLVIVLIVISFIIAYLKYLNYKYILTDTEFKAERGIINKRYISIPYSKIQNVDIKRSLPARILGLSELEIRTAGHNFSRRDGRISGLSVEDAEKIRGEIMLKVNA